MRALKPIRVPISLLVVGRTQIGHLIPSVRQFSLYKIAQNTKFNPDDFKSKRLDMVSKDIPKQLLDTEVASLVKMLHRYNKFTLDLILKDPVILESTKQKLLQYARIILSKYNGMGIIAHLESSGYSKELKILIQLLARIFPKSKSIQLLALRALMELTFAKQSSLNLYMPLIQFFLRCIIDQNPLLAIHLEKSLDKLTALTNLHDSPLYSTQYAFLKNIIVMALLSKSPLLASSFYISLVNSPQFQNTNFITYLLLNNELLSSIVDSLLVLDPMNEAKNLVAIVKLLEFQNEKTELISQNWDVTEKLDINKFKFKLNNTQRNNLLSNSLMLDDEKLLSLKILIFEKILRSNDTTSKDKLDQLALYLRFAYELIESNIKLNNDAIVFFIWSKIDKYHTVLYNSQINSPNNNQENNYYYYSILAKLIRFFSKNQRYKNLVDTLIQNIPIRSCSVNPDLMDALLTHAARNEDVGLSDVLIRQLGADIEEGFNYKYINNLTRGLLSALLGLHLRFNDSEGVDKIVKLIQERFSKGLDHVEMNLICKQILKKAEDPASEFERVWNMYKVLDPRLGKSLAPLIIDTMIERRNINFERIEYIYHKLIMNLDESDEVWEWISGLYIKYLTRNFPLSHAKRVYQNSSRKISRYNRLSNPFAKTFDKALIYLPLKLKKIILKTILDSSIFHKKDNEITYWCLDEFEKLGYGYKEIMVDLSLSQKELNLRNKIKFKDLKFEPILPSDSSVPLDVENESAVFEKDLQDLYLSYLAHRDGSPQTNNNSY